MKYSASYSGKHRFFVFGAVCVGLLAAVIVLYIYRPLPDVVVVRTEKGFSPSTVTVRKGQAVVFKSSAHEDFWPASDFHPTHAVYPEFDPTHALKPDESWRFVFAKAGVWTYHDHLQEYVRGTVIVVGSPGESTRECLSHTATSSARAVANCWAVELTETLQTKGLQAAFDTYARLYAENPSFRGLSCHDAGHILGAEAYKEYSADHKVIDRPETAYCGYGFYHGFIETMLLENGGVYGEVRAYCDALKSGTALNNPSGACYHGIGHAAFDSLPGTLWGDTEKMVTAAAAVCEKAAIGIPEQAQCMTGVYNALAIASSAHSYNLSFPAKPSMHICDIQKTAYRPGCYIEYGIGTIRQFGLDRVSAVRLITSVHQTKLSAEMLRGYAADEVIRSMKTLDLPSFISFCRSFTDKTLRDACDMGVIAGLRQGGEPGKEFEQGFAYCSLIKDRAELVACASQVASQTRLIAADPDAYKHACLKVGLGDTSICD